MSNGTQTSSKDEQLQLLFDYTKFHIGIYVALLAAIIGVLGKQDVRDNFRFMVPWLLTASVFLLVAGGAGALVGSSIPFFSSFEEFSKAKLGPWKWKFIKGVACTSVEHTAFWLAVFVTLVGLFVKALGYGG